MNRFVRNTTIHLPSSLSDDEYKQLTEELVGKTNQLNSFYDKIEQLKSAVSTFKKTHKADICNLESDCRYLAMDLERRSREIEVKCNMIFDRDAGIVLFRRCDTGEIVPSKTRAMTSEEYGEIPFGDPDADLQSASLVKSDFETFLDYLRNSAFSKDDYEKLQIIKNLLSGSKLKSVQSALQSLPAPAISDNVSEAAIVDDTPGSPAIPEDPESF